MIFTRKTKQLKLKIKSLETDLFNITRTIAEVYQKKSSLNKLELEKEISNLLKVASLEIIKETDGYEEFFTSTDGTENIVNRPAFVDKYGNCIVKGYREVKKE